MLGLGIVGVLAALWRVLVVAVVAGLWLLFLALAQRAGGRFAPVVLTAASILAGVGMFSIAGGGLVPVLGVAAILLLAILSGLLVTCESRATAPVPSDSPSAWKRSPTWRPPASVLVVMGLAAYVSLAGSGVAYGRFESILRAMHQPGAAAFDSEAATAPFVVPPDRAASIADAVCGWYAYVPPSPTPTALQPSPTPIGAALTGVGPTPTPTPSPPCVAQTSTTVGNLPADFTARIMLAWELGAVDSIFLVPAYVLLATVLVALGRGMLRRDANDIDQTADQETRERYDRWGRPVLGFLVLGAASDYVENGLVMLQVGSIWPASPAATVPNCWTVAVGWCNRVSMSVLTMASFSKAILLTVVTLYVLLVFMLWLHHSGQDTWSRVRPLIRSILQLRVQIIVLLFLAGALLANEQVPDMVRRWKSSPHVGALGMLMAMVLAAAMGGTTGWLLPAPLQHLGGYAGLARTSPGAYWASGLASRRLEPAARWWAAAGAGIAYALLWLASWQSANDSGWAFAAVVVAGLVVIAIWRRGVHLPEVVGPWPLLAALAPGAVLLLAGVLFAYQLQHGEGVALASNPAELIRLSPFIPFLIAVVIAGLGQIFRDAEGDPPEVTAPSSTLLPWLLAAATMGVFANMLLGLAVEALVFENRPGREVEQFVLFGFGLLGAGLTIGIAVVGLTPIGERVTWWLGRARSPIGAPAFVLGSGLVVWLGGTLVFAGPDRLHNWAPNLGLGLLFAVFTLLVLIGSGALALVSRLFDPPPAVFRFFRIPGVPVVSLAVLWFVLGTTMPPEEVAHDVRVISYEDHGRERNSERLDDAWYAWLTRQCIPAADGTVQATVPGTSTVSSRPAKPVVLIASEGGGIRAAAWTAYVMDRLFPYAPPDNATCDSGAASARRGSSWVFAASGISGGSVGLATYAARQLWYDTGHALQPPTPDVETEPEGPNASRVGRPAVPGWVRQQLGHDSISSIVAWMLFGEGPWAYLRFPLERDRATVLEESFERFWWRFPERPAVGNLDGDIPGLFELRRLDPSLPILMLNGAAARTACRVNVSAVSSDGRPRDDPSSRCLAPSTVGAPPNAFLGANVDVPDFLCSNQEIRLSTAALLSARFPYVSPAGRLTQCNAADPDMVPRVYVVDGGYHEGSGAATILDLWIALEPLVRQYNEDARNPALIVPFLIQITNGYGEPAGVGPSAPPPQFLVPPDTAFKSQSANEARVRQEARLTFSAQFQVQGGMCYGGRRFLPAALRPHPGPTAALGWTLSDTSFDDLAVQLRGRPDWVTLVKGWISPVLGPCSAAPPPGVDEPIDESEEGGE